MLHRSFKPAKCKTSLKLAASRLKLLKNKKDVQLKQMKRELAELLESGKDQTARIRVEHVVREEKAIAAYDLLEIYCEIIAARLPVIESQKNCPIDLKEAITSVIFAAPRCSDITEFVDIRKHFTAKYGKEFATAAIELRPDSGVSRMLVEKLSVKAPDGETKLKILTAIAEEHNIKWDPASFGAQESKPRDDLLNGPSTFDNASKTHIEPPPVQTGPSHTQVPPSPGPKYSNTPASFKQNARQSSNLQNFPSGEVSSGPTTTEAASYHGTMPSGSGSERIEATHSHSRDGNAYSAGNHNWNMEFKDATAAAEAAAEAAERASMAARAAAELAGRGQTRTEYSTESPRFKRQSPRDDRPNERVGSKSGKQFSRDSRQDTVHDKDSEINSDQVDRNEDVKQEGLSERFHQDSRNSMKRSDLASSRPTNSSNDDFKQKKQQEAEVSEVKKSRVFSEVNTSNKYRKSDVDFQSEHVKQEGLSERFHQDSRNSMKRSDLASSRPTNSSNDDFNQKKQQEAEVTEVKKSRVFSEVNTSNKYRKSDEDFQSEDEQDNLHYDDFNRFGEESMEDKASGVTAQSHSSNRDNVFGVSHSSHRMPSIDASENLFSSTDHDTTHGDTVASSSYSDAPVIFDEPLSDDEVFVPYTPVEDPSPSSIRNTIHRDTAPRTSSSSNAAVAFDESDSDSDALGFSSRPVFDESLAETKDVLPVTFDDVEVSSSESEDELVKPGFGELNHNQSRKEQVDVFADSDERVEFGFQSSLKFDSDYVPSVESPSRHSKTSLSSNSMATDNFNDPDSPGSMNNDDTENNGGFKFGSLRGGRRNKNPHFTIFPPVAAAATASKTPPEDSAASSIGAGSSTNSEVISEVERKPSLKTKTRLTGLDRPDTADPPQKSPVSSGGAFSRRTKATPGLVVQSSLNARPNKFSSPTSDSDSSEEEIAEKHFNRKRQSSISKSSQQPNTEPRSEGPFRYFDTTDDRASEALEHTSPVSGRSGNVPSRRTKASPTSGTKPYVKARVSDDLEPKTSSSSYGSEAPSKPESQKVNLKPSNPPTEDTPKRASHVHSKPSSSSFGSETPSKPKHEVNSKPSATKQRLSPPKSAASGSSVSPKLSTSSGNDPPREETPKRASHVHPKLPDYDSLAARFQSLRENRQ